MSTSVMWFRRDLRLRDNPALRAAHDAADDVFGLFVVDPVLWGSAGRARRAWLAASLRSLDASMGGRLVLRLGDPASVVPAQAEAVGASGVFVTGESTPYGAARDARTDVALEAVGTPYAVDPGTVLTGSGTSYKVFTPFFRSWRAVAKADPQPAPGMRWAAGESDGRVAAMLDKALREGPELPTAGEDAAVRRWQAFVDRDLADYDDARDRPDLDRTSRMSPYLKLGIVHPRQLLAQLDGDGSRYTAELAWREFYADVLAANPASAWADLNDLPIPYEQPADAIEAWRRGTTGFPIVDAGMRQLLAEGWMHNRVRMITASFLTKDLHVWWPVGARHFLDHLVDGDLASNNHGWQWVAGTGTDASPYFRVFNPVSQGQRFDPDGAYVRRWVPELAHLPGKAAHEPWKHETGYAEGYPARIVDHDEERREALRRYESRNSSRTS